LPEIAYANRSCVRLLAGNKALYRRERREEELIAYVDRAPEKTERPVSTAETWETCHRNPDPTDRVA